MTTTDEARFLGQKLRAMRKAQGITASHIARQVGCARSTIRRIESGHTDPLMSTIVRYLHVLGMRVTCEVIRK